MHPAPANHTAYGPGSPVPAPATATDDTRSLDAVTASSVGASGGLSGGSPASPATVQRVSFHPPYDRHPPPGGLAATTSSGSNGGAATGRRWDDHVMEHGVGVERSHHHRPQIGTVYGDHGGGDFANADPEPFSLDAHDRMAAEISHQIGAHVSVVFFAIVTFDVSVLSFTQLLILTLRFDAGVGDGTPWAQLLVPSYLLCLTAVVTGAVYFASGVGDVQLEAAGSNGDKDDEMLQTSSANLGTSPATATTTASGTATLSPDSAVVGVPSATFDRPHGGDNSRHAATVGVPASASTSCCVIQLKASTHHTPDTPNESGKLPPQVETDKQVYRAWLLRAQRVTCAMVACYVVATASAGRYASHPHDIAAIVGVVAAVVAEFILLLARLHLVVTGAMPSVVRRSEGLPDLSTAGLAVIGSFKAMTPLLRMIFYVMLSWQIRAIGDGRPLPMRWPAVFAPVYLIEAKLIIVAVVIARAKKQADERQEADAADEADAAPPRDGPAPHHAAVAVLATLIGCICFSTVTISLYLDGTLTWPLGVCLAPLMVLFLLAAGMSALLGCAMASRTVELPDSSAADTAIRGGHGGAVPPSAHHHHHHHHHHDLGAY